MRMPNRRQLKSLEKAAQRYEANPPLDYLGSRGIDGVTAKTWRLGVVESPDPGHEAAVGRLSIPYANRLGVIGFKFRCVIGHDCKEAGCPKYLTPLGQEEFLFNVVAADDDGDTIHITEGELDCVVLSMVLGEPVVGFSGVNAWKPHHPFHFKGWSRVLVWSDGDKAGQDFGRRVRKELGNAEVVPIPNGHDVSSLYLELGAEAIRKLAGREEEE
jgi:DNA primase